jgi:hypothetical protein
MILNNGIIYGFPGAAYMGFNVRGLPNEYDDTAQYCKTVNCPNFEASYGKDAYVSPYNGQVTIGEFSYEGTNRKQDTRPECNPSYDSTLLLGASDTPVSKEDGGLKDLIWHTDSEGYSNTYLLQTNCMFKVRVEGKGLVPYVTSTFQNGTNETFTVKEIGIGRIIGGVYVIDGSGSSKQAWLSSSDNNTNKTNICLVREVLPSPVEIKPGDTYTFVIEFKGLLRGTDKVSIPTA